MYDIIVIGRDVSSLVAACLAVHRGRSTLLLEEEGPAHTFSLPGGYVFDLDPLPWTGLNSNGVFTKFLKDMDVDCPQSDAPEAVIQAVLKNRCVDLPGTMEERCREIARDFSVPDDRIRAWHEAVCRNSLFIKEMVPKYLDRGGGAREKTGNLFREVRGRALWKYKSLKENFSLPDSEELKGIIEAEQALFARYAGPDEKLSSDGASYCLSSSLAGGFRLPQGGKQAIISALKDRIRAGGGMILSCDTVAEIRFGKSVIVELEQGGETVSLPAGRVIVSTRWRGLPSLLQGDPRLSICFKTFYPRKQDRWPFTLHMGVHEHSLPEMMGEQVIVLLGDSKQPCPILPFIYLNRTLSGAGESAPPGKSALAATIMLLESPRKTGDDELASLASFLLEFLGRPFPFLADAIHSFDLDMSIRMSRVAAEACDFGYRAKERGFFGFPLRDGTTPLETLYLTGGELAPLLGFDGDVVSGITAACAALGEESYVYYPHPG